MMFLKSFPRFTTAATRSCFCPRAVAGTRLYYRSSKHLPIWKANRSLVEDFFFPRRGWGPFVAMNSMMKNMDRMMEEMWRSPGISWAPGSPTGKEVEVTYNGKKFEVKLDVRHYNPEDINVKVLGDDKLEISGKHSEETDEYGTVSREFTRQFLIPEDVDVETTESLLHDDGWLTITAKVKADENANERVINIKREEKSNSPQDKKG